MKEKSMTMNLGEMLRAKLAGDTFKQDTKSATAMQLAAQAKAFRSELEQDMMNRQGALMSAAIHSGIISGQGVYNMVQESSFNPNEQPAYQVSLTALCDLWRAKHGDEWVRGTHDDEFWIDAVQRLGGAGKLETMRGWLRLKD